MNKLWTAIYIEGSEEDAHWVYLTNEDGVPPDESDSCAWITITQGRGPLKTLKQVYGKSRVHNGREISVYVNGERV